MIRQGSTFTPLSVHHPLQLLDHCCRVSIREGLYQHEAGQAALYEGPILQLLQEVSQSGMKLDDSSEEYIQLFQDILVSLHMQSQSKLRCLCILEDLTVL